MSQIIAKFRAEINYKIAQAQAHNEAIEKREKALSNAAGIVEWYFIVGAGVAISSLGVLYAGYTLFQEPYHRTAFATEVKAGNDQAAKRSSEGYPATKPDLELLLSTLLTHQLYPDQVHSYAIDQYHLPKLQIDYKILTSPLAKGSITTNVEALGEPEHLLYADDTGKVYFWNGTTAPTETTLSSEIKGKFSTTNVGTALISTPTGTVYELGLDNWGITTRTLASVNHTSTELTHFFWNGKQGYIFETTKGLVTVGRPGAGLYLNHYSNEHKDVDNLMAPLVADLDGDGIVEIITRNNERELIVKYTGQKNRTWPIKPIKKPLLAEEGSNTIVTIATAEPSIHVLQTKRGGQPIISKTELPLEEEFTHPNTVWSSEDLNNDGINDLLYSFNRTLIAAYATQEGIPQEAWRTETKLHREYFRHTPVLVDLTGDQKPEIIVRTNREGVYILSSQGEIQARLELEENATSLDHLYFHNRSYLAITVKDHIHLLSTNWLRLFFKDTK